MNPVWESVEYLAMSEPNVEEIVTYLSTKFNKIFCDREFVSCVSNDFHKLRNKYNKCCVLVFPALGSLYQRALKYQAKAFDLASFSISGSTFKTIVVCQKEYLLHENKQEPLERQEKMSSDQSFTNKNAESRKKRPERPLYVPPAQRRLNKDTRGEIKNKIESPHDRRRHSDRKIISKVSECGKFASPIVETKLEKCSKAEMDIRIISLHDLMHLNFLPLPKYTSNLNRKIDNNILSLNYIHKFSCKFNQYLSSECHNDFQFCIPVYHPNEMVYLQLLINNYLCWQPFSTDDLIDYREIIENNCAIPFFNYIKNADSDFLNSDLTNNLTLNQVKLFSKIKYSAGHTGLIHFDTVVDIIETETIFNDEYHDGNSLRIICNNEPFENIVDLTSFNMGHYFRIQGANGSEYFHICDQSHDVLACYMEVEKELLSINKSSTSECSSSQKKDEVVLIQKNTLTKDDKDDILVLTEQKIESEVIKKPEVRSTKKIHDSKKKCQHEEEKEIMRKAKENINRRTRPLMKYSDDSDDFLKIDKHDNVNNWEDLFDDNGQIQEELLTEIEHKVGKDLTIVKASEDYTPYMQKPVDNLEHVVEIYNFPPSLTTGDIIHAFNMFDSDSMYIVWVDDTHALLVLGSSSQAQRAVELQNPLIKVRSMSNASSAAISIAGQYDLKPAMKRPQTNLQTARRLITSHLGTKSRVTKEQTAKEREHLRKAREQRNITRQNEKDAWEGNIRSSLRH